MKSVLIFSNPFGLGPSGKAASIAKYLSEHTANTNIIICGSKYLCGVTGNKFAHKQINDRDEASITRMLNSISGSRYVFSSQNRFAIRSANKCGIPSAFLDGLSWFWREIPEEHFLADIVFWINYPGIRKKVPADQKSKTIVVGGITEGLGGKTSCTRNGTIFYLGGCKNPLMSMPRSYLDLAANLLELVLSKSLVDVISTDCESKKYFCRYPSISKKTKMLDHTNFMKRIARSELLVTNGGQTAATEATSLGTSIGFFLPMNLSQISLINKILLEDVNYPSLKWDKYIKLSPDLYSYSEKQALKYFEDVSDTILKNKKQMNALRADFLKMLTLAREVTPPKILKNLGSTGAVDVCSTLKAEWGLD